MTTPVRAVSQLAVNVLDAHSLLAAFGVLGVAVVMFAETGMMIGFFLPGDSLLFTAGLLCSGSAEGSLHLTLGPLLVAAAAGALAGAQCGYVLGRKAGGALLARSRSRRLHEGVKRAEELLERYGYAKTIVLARFVPVVRTVLNPMAGTLEVPVRMFTLWQVVGGLAWSIGLTLAGFALGSSIPNVDRYLLPLVALIVVVSLIPLACEVYRGRQVRGWDGGDHRPPGPVPFASPGGREPVVCAARPARRLYRSLGKAGPPLPRLSRRTAGHRVGACGCRPGG